MAQAEMRIIINKKEIFGNRNIGITEFLAQKERISGKEVMLIYNKKISVSPITTHLPIKYVSKYINKNKIIKNVQSNK